MLLEYILKNFLYYFLPLAVPSTIVLFTLKKIQYRKKIIIVLCVNLLLFTIVVTISALICPTETPLQVEWTFYALEERPEDTYKLHSLLGEGTPAFLGLKDILSSIEGIPIAHSGEQCQMRFKINRKGYIYVFHFDTILTDLRQLFPSKDVQNSNPVRPDSWVELPSHTKTWKFDQNPGLEAFIAYVSIKESNAIREKIRQIMHELEKSSTGKADISENFPQQLMAFAPINFAGSGEFVHNLMGVKPLEVKTCTYQARDGKTALLLQFVMHEP